MSNSMIGIIPAAGSGVRARPYSYEIHKGLFAIDGKSNIARTIEIMRDDLGIKDIVIVIGYMGEAIQASFGDGHSLGVNIIYEANENLDKGWAWSVLMAKPHLAGRRACVMLCDEFYLGSNHKDLLDPRYGNSMVTVAVKHVDDPELIKKNFMVELNGERIVRLVENPVNVPNDILGMATFVVAPEVFDALEQGYDAGRPAIEFVNFIDELIRDGHSVTAFEMTGEYINLNDVSSLEGANDLAIHARMTGKTT